MKPFVPTQGLSRRHFQRCMALGALAGVLPATGLAQDAGSAYPSGPLRLVVPFTPGGSTDMLGRVIAQDLFEAWGKAVVVDNIPGAGGSIGADRVAKAKADGYTLLMGHIGTLAVTPSLYKNLPYDPDKAFTAVAWVARVPNVLVVHPWVPAKQLSELLAHAKAHRGQINYGSGGVGSAAHIATEYLKLVAQVDMTHIPYKGTAPAVTDLLGGRLQAMFTGIPAVLPQIKSGKLRALAVSSPQRSDLLPDVPTVAESGFAGFEADQWYGVVAPAGTPASVIAKLNQQINASLDTPQARKRLADEGAQAMPTTPEAFDRLIQSEIKRWREVIEKGRISL